MLKSLHDIAFILNPQASGFDPTAAAACLLEPSAAVVVLSQGMTPLKSKAVICVSTRGQYSQASSTSDGNYRESMATGPADSQPSSYWDTDSWHPVWRVIWLQHKIQPGIKVQLLNWKYMEEVKMVVQGVTNPVLESKRGPASPVSPGGPWLGVCTSFTSICGTIFLIVRALIIRVKK